MVLLEEIFLKQPLKTGEHIEIRMLHFLHDAVVINETSNWSVITYSAMLSIEQIFINQSSDCR